MSETEPPPPATRFPAFRHRDFFLLWIANVVSRLGVHMRDVALGWHLWKLTHSELALGLVGACRVVPIAALALGGGLVADAYDRRRVMLVTQTVYTLSSALLAWFTWRGQATPIYVYASIALSAATGAFDAPARQTLATNLLPPEDLANGLTLNITGMQIAQVLGPALGGVAIAATSIEAVYAIDAVTYLVLIAALLVVRPRPMDLGSIAKAPEVSAAAVKEALRFLWSKPALVWLMVADFFATFFAGSMQLLPAFADKVFHVGESGLGALTAAPAVGSVIASVVTGWRRPIERWGVVVLAAIVVYGLAIASFGVTTSFALALAFLALSGAADSVSTVVRQVARQTLTPDAMRGRMTGVNMIFFIGGPQLGEVEAGAVAQAWGARVSVVSGGVACVVSALVIALTSRALRTLRRAAPVA